MLIIMTIEAAVLRRTARIKVVGTVAGNAAMARIKSLTFHWQIGFPGGYRRQAVSQSQTVFTL